MHRTGKESQLHVVQRPCSTQTISELNPEALLQPTVLGVGNAVRLKMSQCRKKTARQGTEIIKIKADIESRVADLDDIVEPVHILPVRVRSDKRKEKGAKCPDGGSPSSRIRMSELTNYGREIAQNHCARAGFGRALDLEPGPEVRLDLDGLTDGRFLDRLFNPCSGCSHPKSRL